MNMNFNIAKDYEGRLNDACDEFSNALYDSKIDQGEFAYEIADSAGDKLDNYHQMKGLLKRHPELKNEPLFKNIKQQYDGLMDVNDNEYTVGHYHGILVDYAEQEEQMEANGIEDGLKLNRKAM